MATILEALQAAVGHHQAGRLDAAEKLYRQVLQVDPRNIDALNLLGAVSSQRGRHDLAVDLIRRAIAIHPSFPEAHNNLGTALREQGRLDEAIECYRRALGLDPSFADAHNNLGVALFELSKRNAATDPETAIAGYRRAIELNPRYAEAYNNLGVALQSLGKFDEALAAYKQSIAVSHERYADAFNNLGGALKAMGMLEDAIVAYRQAIQRKPNFFEAHNNLGVVQQMLGDAESAIQSYRAALTLKPDYVDAHNNLAHGLLLCGKWTEGWREYEWRWRAKSAGPQAKRREMPGLWDGSNPDGKRILVYFEQGYGDIFQFVRYTQLLKQMGATVLFESPESLHRLLKSCAWIDLLVEPRGPTPEFDFHIPLLSLPFLMQTVEATIPAKIPYLAAESELVAKWRRQLEKLDGVKVGIAWQGNRQYCHDRWRSIPLRAFAPLAKVSKVQLISMQAGDGTEQLASLAGLFQVHVFDLQDKSLGAFVDTAALLASLDLVVTSDTAIAHLAGALGLPVWLATSKACDWRWQRTRNDSPWYPTMRLFRQSTIDGWESVFQQMAEQLSKGSMV